MNKFKQSAYTVMLLATCFILSPFIFMQIWKNSQEAKKIPNIPKPAVTETANGQPPATEPVQTDPAPPATAEDGGTVTTAETSAAETTATTTVTTALTFVPSDISYFDDALFIGDSRTVGLSEYGNLQNADYYCDVGLSAAGITSSYAGGRGFYDVLSGRSYGKIYVMLGINEVGNDFEYTMAAYRNMVEEIKNYQPQAIIYLQANLHVSYEAETNVINNASIDYLNSQIQQLADNKTVFYIDVNQVFDNEYGYLNSDITGDGVHPKGQYYQEWSDWIATQTVPDNMYHEVTTETTETEAVPVEAAPADNPPSEEEEAAPEE